jgi:MFS family permease
LLLPVSATRDAGRLVAARGLRGFVDGLVSVLLASWLSELGFSAFEIGAIVTATLLGSALCTIAVGLLAHRLDPQRVLLAACALMAGTGAGFGWLEAFWPLALLAFVGTLNPSGGDVSVFLPIEQSLLAGEIAPHDRTSLFARYALTGSLAAAAGSLAIALPGLSGRGGFALYAATAVALAALYAGLRTSAPRALEAGAPLARSRRVVLELSALFSLDSFGGGFVVQSLLALWLFRRFDLSLAAAGAFFFGASLLSAASQLASPPLARRIGLVRTMAYTHLPANLFLAAAAFAPSASSALALLLARAALSQMDVPARQSYVMAMVPPEERAAAASVTNVPRSLAAAAAPLLAGTLLEWSSVGWPLLAAGSLKAIYDLLLLWRFRAQEPPPGA